MILIILAAFANFFYIINFNSNANPNNYFEHMDFTYLPSNLGRPVMDSILTMYLIALGEFNTDGFAEGPNVTICWFFFVMASFIILIVFMNMLITIVGETFGRVESMKEELSLSEQLFLIQDHLFLIDLKEKFNDKKYIIRLYPDVT